MEFTFGIITDGTAGQRLNAVIHSIEILKIPTCEILIVGGDPIKHPHIKHIPFDETVKTGWITKKKNIITEHARYNNIVYMHDYFALDKDWYTGWQQFYKIDPTFDVVVNKIWMNFDNVVYRHADWVINPYDYWKVYPQLHWKDWEVALPYDARGFEDIQYISGGFWVGTKKFMETHPLDENLCWGQSEDTHWSEHARKDTRFRLNIHSTTWVLKPNKWTVVEMPADKRNALIEHYGLTVTYE